MRKKGNSILSFVALSLISFGCNFGPPTPPVTPLTYTQVREVESCQATIKAAGRNFVETKLNNVEECLDNVLEIQLQYENGLISQYLYNHQLALTRYQCAQSFQQVGYASTELINNIIQVCGPISSIILPGSGYDPLQLDALASESDNGPEGFTNITQYAGNVCGIKELAVDAMIGYQVPRMANLLLILDNNTGQFAITEDSGEFVFPNIPLDSRCTAISTIFE
jgi:hypothetical protein